MKFKLLLLFVALTIFITACGTNLDKKVSSKPLTNAQKIRIQQIVTNVIQDKNQPTKKLHSEFWSIMNQLGNPSGDDIAAVRETFVSPTVDYMKLVYEDAKVAIKQGSTYKSDDRQALEQHLLEIGLLTNARIVQSDTTIVKIARKQPVQIGNKSFTLNATQLQQIIDGLDATRDRLDKLFTP